MAYWDKQTVEKIRQGFYSALYFNRTKQILLKDNNRKQVTMQVFQKKHAVLCGIDQILELFKVATGYFEDAKWIDKSHELDIESLTDGDATEPWLPVMHITGPYLYFAHLESLYLGILARQTKIATNTQKVVTAANSKPVIFFADRFDYFLNQEIDGYAAKVGGVQGVATAAQGVLWNGKVFGTIPHALITVHDGNTLKASEQFAKHFSEVRLIALVDYENDCVNTSLEVARAFGEKLFAVRIDTSETIIDKSLQSRNDQSLTGVNSELVSNVRHALDSAGYSKVKIIVSGGFTAEKVEQFEKEQVPVDMYGVGSSLLQGNNDFTADCVRLEGKDVAKYGRKYMENKKLCKQYLSK